jgi:hypothetical protein
LRKRASAMLGAALLAAAMLASLAPSGAQAASSKPVNWQLLQYLRTHGYLPLHGEETLARAKAYSAALIAEQHGTAPAPVTSAAAPTIGASWDGQFNTGVSPADANGAIGPNSYIEIINLNIGIYNRTGGLITSGTLSSLTGHFSLSDPTILWDPASHRFFYDVWDVSASTQAWGFSKTDNPTTIPGSFCNYTASFGYNPSTDIPDYPKLGQTKDFLLIGANHYPSFSSLHADRSDVMWISKYKDPNPVTTCPASSTFKTGLFKNLRNQDGTEAFTPIPAIQTDSSSTGFVVTMSDIECPDICGSGTFITVHAVRPNPADPTVPQLLTTGKSVTVPSYTSPPDAPQKGSTKHIDTLDGRITHAVEGIDPAHGGGMNVWVAHTVAGGAGSQVNWYEIRPTPVSHPTLTQSGVVSDASLFVYDAGIGIDRTVNDLGSAHGDAMVLGVTTSSSTAYASAQMVSKIGAGAQSALVMVHASTTFDNDFTCNVGLGALTGCRWGDYASGSADPAASLTALHGEVWMSNAWTNGTNRTWNWEAKP